MDTRSITTDMGVEHYLCDVKIFLATWALQTLGLRCSAAFASQKFLLPLCVGVPDWNHDVGKILGKTLKSMRRWPSFLEKAFC